MSLHLLFDSGLGEGAALAALSRAAIWLDASDLGSMRQGRSGAGVAAVNQPVGLWINKGSTGTSGRSIEAALGANVSSSMVRWTAAGSPPSDPAGQWTLRRASDTSFHYGAEIAAAHIGGAWHEVRATVTASGLEAGSMAQLECALGRVDFGSSGSVSMIVRPSTSSPIGGYRFLCAPGNSAVISQISIRPLPGSHFTAPSDAARSVLRAGYLEPDGVDDWMTPSTSLTLGETWWHIGAWQSSINARYAFSAWGDYRGAYRLFINSPAGWASRTSGDTDSAYLTTSSAGAVHVATIERLSHTSARGRHNGGAETSATTFQQSLLGSQGLALFSEATDVFSAGISGRFYGGAWGVGGIATADRVAIERHFAARAGVTL